MRTLLASALILLATPALAQFPPPGVYTCAAETGENFGELNLFAAGDYSFRNVDGNSASGQIASAGTDISPLSGPLRDMNLTGSFATADDGATTIQFVTADDLEIVCK